MEAGLEIRGLNKSYENLTVFRDFDITFQKGMINCILGPSGCGKTTLLNLISGASNPQSIMKNDFREKDFSYVFQEPRLLPWKTAEENLIFSLRDVLPKNELYMKVKEYLKLVELDEFRYFYPSKLSGGMKQRLSLARAFSFPSEVILMDEPFKALDMKLKTHLMDRFKQLWRKDRRTVIFVTHDVDEAIELGDNIRVLEGPPVKIIREYKVNPENKYEVRTDVFNRVYRR
ncbi:MAG: ABC transporter ATP-binding protein [Bacteroidota bacterium]